MKYYAIADIHGRYDLLDKALKAIPEYLQKQDDKDYLIITLGDYVDRGPDSKKVIERLIHENETDCFISLQGNHEQIMLQSITQKMKPDWWIGNGGGQTLISYGHPPFPIMSYAYGLVTYMNVPEDHLKWIASLDLYYETEKQVFVHAGIPHWDMNLEKASDNNREKMQWMLYDRNDSGGWRGKHVVHGHHQFEDGPHVWLNEKKGGRTDLDCWAYHTGRLVVGVFDNTQLHAIDYIEIKE